MTGNGQMGQRRRGARSVAASWRSSMARARELPIPPHFDRSRVGEVWRVPYVERAAQAEAWAKAHGIKAAAQDQAKVSVMIVDAQNSFCIPGHELFVGGRSGRGAVDDNVRLCEFIYRNLGTITDIQATMDTHTGMQIFHPVFWLDPAGRHPPPNTVVSVEDVERGAWRVNPAVAHSVSQGDLDSLQRYALHYVRKLSEGGKYPLIIWPYHCMLGGIGHALASAVEEACFFHSIARQSQTGFQTKGDNPLTENYSVLRPEVLDYPDGRPLARKNRRFLQELLVSDVLVIAGQAKSHCVAWTVEDLLGELMPKDPDLVRKVYLLEDCTSSVVVPGVVDFTAQADEAFHRFAAAGMHVVRSTDPVAAWPGVAPKAVG